MNINQWQIFQKLLILINDMNLPFFFWNFHSSCKKNPGNKKPISSSSSDLSWKITFVSCYQTFPAFLFLFFCSKSREIGIFLSIFLNRKIQNGQVFHWWIRNHHRLLSFYYFQHIFFFSINKLPMKFLFYQSQFSYPLFLHQKKENKENKEKPRKADFLRF